jgi:hypothetical protein
MTASDGLEWVCDVCRMTIADSEGMLWVDVVAAESVGRARLAWDSAHASTASLSEYLSRPRQVRWHVVHYRCDPDPDAAAYMVEVATARTAWELLDWTAHFMGKSWVGHTDWDQVIARVARDRVMRKGPRR